MAVDCVEVFESVAFVGLPIVSTKTIITDIIIRTRIPDPILMFADTPYKNLKIGFRGTSEIPPFFKVCAKTSSDWTLDLKSSLEISIAS